MDISQQIIAYNAILRRELVRIIRIWPQTICPSIITAALNIIVFGKLIGSQISNHQHSHPYINYIIPGLIIMAIIINSYENTVSSFFVPKYMKSIEELLISPTSSHIIIIAYISGSLFRSMIIGCMIYILSMFFSSVAIANLGLLILLSIITSIIFAIAGLINAFIARSFDDISWFPSFILTPMIFFGGLFYNIDNLSQKWQKISSFNPLFHILQIYRSCFFEEINCNVSLVLTLMVASMLLIYAIAIRLLNQDIRK